MADRNTDGRTLSATSGNASPNDRADAPQRGPSLSICIFCGSSYGDDPAYAQAARELGRLIGEGGHRLVFGGGGIGLMGETARAARDAGADVIGILPAFLRHLEPPLKSAEELIITPDLQQRKARMLALADAFVLLPGGMGTMDEFFEVATTAQLAVHRKPIVLVNVKGYFDPLKALVDHIIAHEFARAEVLALHQFARSPEDALRLISSRPVLS
jgi:uncharacterized protein (TIGR00730 family)